MVIIKYNGKIKATKCDGDSGIKGGGVYEVVDGLIIDSEGDKRPVGHRGFKTFDDLTSYYPEFGFVEEFTLDDLKAGMLVVRRNGDKLMVMPCGERLALVNEDYLMHCTIERSYDGFKSIHLSERDIVRVYGFANRPEDVMSFSTENRQLLCEAEGEEIALTFDEIKEKLGLNKDAKLVIKE